MGVGLPFRKDRVRDIGLLVRRLVVFALPAIVIVGAVGGNLVMAALKEKPETKEDSVKATPVVVVEAQNNNVRLSVTTQGEANPRTQINLAPYVSGQIDFVSPDFIEGGAFAEGDVLIRIKDDEYKFRVTQARSAVAQAKSRYATEKAEAEAAKREFDELKIGEGSDLALRKPQLAEAAAMLASAKASLSEAELQLARTKIVAPFNGRVSQKIADLGEFVSPGATLGDIFSTDVMEVELPLTDEELGQLGLSIGFREVEDNLGPNVTLTAIVAGVPRAWSGRVVRTNNSFDKTNRTLSVYAEVEDPYGEGSDAGTPLAAGLFVTATIDGRAIDNAVTIPRSAMRGDGQVFVVRADDTLEIRDVVVAKSDRNHVIVTAGLAPSERVITSPVRGAATGMKVAVAGDGGDDTTKVADRTATQD